MRTDERGAERIQPERGLLRVVRATWRPPSLVLPAVVAAVQSSTRANGWRAAGDPRTSLYALGLLAASYPVHRALTILLPRSAR